MLGKFYLSVAVVLSSFLFLGTTQQAARINASKPARERAHVTATNILHAAANIDSTKEKCATCHEDEVASFDNGTHSKTMHAEVLPCENCHGDATKHLADGGGKGTMRSFAKLSPSEASQVCLSCHEKTGKQSHMSQSEHMLSGVPCTTCHDVHPSGEAKLERASHGASSMMRAEQKELCTSCHKQIDAEFALPTHHRMKEGVMECSSCHNPHGSTEQKQLLADSKENCIKCHEDKRGPFAFEHDAGNLGGCISCHQPHGSSGPHLLKVRDARTLCISCHSREGAAGVPHSRLSLQASGDCTRCHSEIHGSHSDPFFTH